MAKKTKKDSRKIRRMEMEKVKTGDGKPMYKTTHHYHSEPGKEGKGFGSSIGRYHEPEEHFHNSKKKAMDHIKQNFHRIVADPSEQIDQPQLSGDESQPGNEPGESVEE